MKDKLTGMAILLVDDNEANTDLLKWILEEEGFDNLIAINDSRSVKGILEEKKIDLIILDIRMPYMDGFEVMEMIKRDFPNLKLPIIVVTAEDENREKSLQLGATDFITKPFMNWEINLRINNALINQHYFKREEKRAEDLHRLVKERTAEIEDTQREVVRRLGKASEFRDNETGMHIIRMSNICYIIAKKMGCDDNYSDLLLNASSLHDVGKIGIPDSILLKPGRLDSDERNIMETHVNIGYEVLSGHHSPLLTMAAEIALYHHEKWDGTGYPKGLKGEDIPVSARISSIADVVDALLSKRPYKEAWPIDKVLDFITDGKGKHFDPDIVDIFIEEIEAIVEMRNLYLD
jgi:putative two-component system response regulator